MCTIFKSFRTWRPRRHVLLGLLLSKTTLSRRLILGSAQLWRSCDVYNVRWFSRESSDQSERLFIYCSQSWCCRRAKRFSRCVSFCGQRTVLVDLALLSLADLSSCKNAGSTCPKRGEPEVNQVQRARQLDSYSYIWKYLTSNSDYW